jgi:predicted nuclease of predicted toxin-antitoxin system
MKILLDECLPKKLKLEIEADVVLTVPEAGWASKKNGELLGLAAGNFDVFLTTDQNLEFQ